MVSERDLRGHVWIASFLFTSCGTVCPTLSAKLAILQRRMTDPSLRFVSFSVDPARDTPPRLKAYAERFRPNEGRWLLLSSSPSELDQVLRGMHVVAEPSGDVRSPISHTSLLFLVDRAGWVRGVYDASDASDDSLDALDRDARPLRAVERPSVRPSDGASLYRQLGCGGCHDAPRLAPTLVSLRGQRIMLSDGRYVTADADYLRESIVAPSAKLAVGYGSTMPAYEAELTREELDSLVDYLSRL